MEQFDEIRPYHDNEVRPTLNRLITDNNFLNIMARHSHPVLTKKCGRLMEWLTGVIVRRQLRGINDIRGLQGIIEPYLGKIIDNTTSRVSFSGLDKLMKGKPYLFLSNHRDIVLDPALVNYGVYRHGMETPRIAIGDNLLSRPFVSDLMRLNKSFIVKRSVSGRREKLKAYQTLSAYIHHSIDTGHSIWIAQSEGRAKDGNDQTDTAIIKMLHMSKKGKDISFSNSIRSLNIVPVAISYEYDPCDQKKAFELYNTEQAGHYQKARDEDMLSIATGIEGFKGHVHVAFGSQLTENLDNATDVSQAVDDQIHSLYKLHPSNYIAWDLIKEDYPDIKVPDIKDIYPNKDIDDKRQEFLQRLNRSPKNHQRWLLNMYGRPIINRYKSSTHAGKKI